MRLVPRALLMTLVGCAPVTLDLGTDSPGDAPTSAGSSPTDTDDPVDTDDPDTGDPQTTPTANDPVDDPSLDIRERLEAIDGMTVNEVFGESSAATFELRFEQPIDHDDPGAGTFSQYITLSHVGIDRPMVLANTGYSNYLYFALSEPAELFDTNQITVEQRFFGESMPDVDDWSALTIEQAANDHHRIVTQLRRIYPEAWLSTGGSKGGMTSIYHRRFFPDDVDATIAYVAPISFGAPDTRYSVFFDEVIDPSCVDRVRDFQVESLDRWDALLAIFQSETQGMNLSYTIAGSKEAAFENMISGFEWWFWQYLGMDYCSYIPGTGASDSDLFEILAWQGLENGTDDRITPYQAYYYQAMTQLGYPTGSGYLSGRLNHPYENSVITADVGPIEYDPDVMVDIQDWVSSEGSELLFVYGEYDPWTAGEFSLGGASDSASFTVSEGSHYANLGSLSRNDQEAALEMIARWLDSDPRRSSERSRTAETRWMPRPIELPRPIAIAP